MRVLVVEDNALLRHHLKVQLQELGHQVDAAEDAREADYYLGEHLPDIAIVDLGLPDGDGIDFIRDLRQWSQMPIIVLSARSEEHDKIAALDAGADDYLSKPFGIGELQARLRVALRRHGAAQADEPVVRFADLEVNIPARRILRGSEEIHLTPIEFRLLAALLNNPGKVLTQRQLLNQVWGPNAVEHSHYLRIYMGHLRQKLEADPARPQHLRKFRAVRRRALRARHSAAAAVCRAVGHCRASGGTGRTVSKRARRHAAGAPSPVLVLKGHQPRELL